MKIILFLLLLFTTPFLFGQVLQIKVEDKSGFPINNYKVYVNGKLRHSFQKADFSQLTISTNDTVLIRHPDYVGDLHVFSGIIIDTMYHVFELEEKFKSLGEVQITSKKYSKISGMVNENVLDFLVFPNYLLTLKSNGKTYFLERETQTKAIKYNLSFHGIRMFLDNFGNVHVCSKDSSYQVYFDQEDLLFISKSSIKDFQEKIENLIVKANNQVVYQDFSMENKYYRLKSISANRPDSLVYGLYDKTMYKVAKYHYNKCIKIYMATTPPEQNLITLGFWDGDVIKLLNGSFDLTCQVGWYVGIQVKPLNIQAFGLLDYTVIVNLHEDSVVVIDFSTNTNSTKPLDCKKMKSKKVFHDYFYDKLYVLSCKNGATKINYLKPSTGELKEMATLDDLQFTSNIKISNTHIYFLQRNEAGFNKLYRTNL